MVLLKWFEVASTMATVKICLQSGGRVCHGRRGTPGGGGGVGGGWVGGSAGVTVARDVRISIEKDNINLKTVKKVTSIPYRYCNLYQKVLSCDLYFIFILKPKVRW